MNYHEGNTAYICDSYLYLESLKESFSLIQTRGLGNVFISSSGGAAINLPFGIAHMLPRNITTIAGDTVGSVALDLFLCGSTRLALPDSQFFFHEVGITAGDRRICQVELELLLEIAMLDGNVAEADKLANVLLDVRHFNRLTAEFIHQRTQLSVQTVRDLMHGEGCAMDAREALFYGFVHEVIPHERVSLM